MCRAPALCWRAPFGGTVFLLNTVHQKSKYWNAKCFEYNLIVVAYYTTRKTQIWLDIQIGGFNFRYFRGLFGIFWVDSSLFPLKRWTIRKPPPNFFPRSHSLIEIAAKVQDFQSQWPQHLNKWKNRLNTLIWMFPKIRVPQNGWFLMENLIEMDDLGVRLFSETPIYLQ